MLHEEWLTKEPIKQVKVVQTQAKKYKVSDMLTIGETYDVVNETEEYYHIRDNSGKVGGYYKEYFEEI
jgi:SH3-like domain-containing protein